MTTVALLEVFLRIRPATEALMLTLRIMGSQLIYSDLQMKEHRIDDPAYQETGAKVGDIFFACEVMRTRPFIPRTRG